MRRIAAATRAVLRPAVALLALLALAGPGAAHPRPGPCLPPSGGDDTAALQAALDRCTGSRRPCVVSLCDGDFHTGILRVRGFQGTLAGAGPHLTVLRAASDLPVNDNPAGYYLDDPLAEERDPWPYLLQFVGGGGGRVRDLAIEVPPPPVGAHPTTGWYFFEETPPIHELAGALLVTGPGRTDFRIENVRVEAGAYGELGTAVLAGIAFEGAQADPGDPLGATYLPAGGRFEVVRSTLAGTLLGLSLFNLDGAHVGVKGSVFSSLFGVDAVELSRSSLVVAGNRFESTLGGLQVFQNTVGGPAVGRTLVLVRDNEGKVAPGGNGVLFQDAADLASDRTTALAVLDNDLTLGGGEDAAASAVSASGAGHLLVRGNRVVGRAAIGLDLDRTEGCRVTGNDLGGLDTDPGPDLRLGRGTSDCLAVVGRGDAVVDGGSANRVVHR